MSEQPEGSARKQFGAMLRDARKALDPPMTQQAVADKIGVVQGAVGNWEAGLSYPALSVVDNLAGVLHLDAEELVAHIVNAARGEKAAAKA